MKRLRGVFELTVAEQRVVIVLLFIMLGFAAAKTYRDRTRDAAARSTSYNPGIRP